MPTAPVTVNRSTVIHLGHLSGGHWGVRCGAVRYRNAKAATITRRPADTEVTCTKCSKAEPAAPAAPVEAEPLTFMQRQRLAGKAR